MKPFTDKMFITSAIYIALCLIPGSGNVKCSNSQKAFGFHRLFHINKNRINTKIRISILQQGSTFILRGIRNFLY